MSLRVDNATSESDTLSTTSEEIAPARPTRRQLTVINRDGSILVHIAMDTAATAAHAAIPAGGTVVLVGTGQWNAIAASGTPIVSVIDEFD